MFVRTLDLNQLDVINNIFSKLYTYLTTEVVGFEWTDIDIVYKEECVGTSYPCGTKRCSRKVLGRRIYWPCGVEMCGQVVCTVVPVPTTVKAWIEYSVEDIIEGTVALAEGGIMNVLNNAIEKQVESMGIVPPNPFLPMLPYGGEYKETVRCTCFLIKYHQFFLCDLCRCDNHYDGYAGEL